MVTVQSSATLNTSVLVMMVTLAITVSLARATPYPVKTVAQKFKVVRLAHVTVPMVLVVQVAKSLPVIQLTCVRMRALVPLWVVRTNVHVRLGTPVRTVK